jgi:hypothetical protein
MKGKGREKKKGKKKRGRKKKNTERNGGLPEHDGDGGENLQRNAISITIPHTSLIDENG